MSTTALQTTGLTKSFRGLEVLRAARPTSVGQALLDGMRAMEAAQRAH